MLPPCGGDPALRRPRRPHPHADGPRRRAHLLGPGIDLDTHITDVVAVLHYEDLRDVILVGHSYGGMVIPGVADRALDRVGHLVYLDAATPVNGESLADIAARLMDAARRQAGVVDADLLLRLV